MSDSEAKTFLLVKYGSVQSAYWIWRAMTDEEEAAAFTAEQLQILREFEITDGLVNLVPLA